MVDSTAGPRHFAATYVLRVEMSRKSESSATGVNAPVRIGPTTPTRAAAEGCAGPLQHVVRCRFPERDARRVSTMMETTQRALAPYKLSRLGARQPTRDTGALPATADETRAVLAGARILARASPREGGATEAPLMQIGS